MALIQIGEPSDRPPEHSRDVESVSFPWPPPDEPNRAPYRGLKALEPLDAAVFFGVTRGSCAGSIASAGLVEHLLVILGASGSGKSSFLRAGLWPRLLRDDPPQDRNGLGTEVP